MKPRILLINPPVYDFTAYNFWLKPYGLLSVGGYMRGKAELTLLDLINQDTAADQDEWGLGPIPSESIDKPGAFTDIPRKYKRFGRKSQVLRELLVSAGNMDLVLIGTEMTYWYPGVSEVIEEVRAVHKDAKIILGGIYASLCPVHAGSLGADMVIEGDKTDGLWKLCGIQPDYGQSPYWEGYRDIGAGVMKISRGCPFRCSYCSVPISGTAFGFYDLEKIKADFLFLYKRGVKNIAFYDDALLYQPERIFHPFLEWIIRSGFKTAFHTPNALHAGFLTKESADLMVRAGFRSFFLGVENTDPVWLKKTGGKVQIKDIEKAVKNLTSAGASSESITAYIILGHPEQELKDTEASLEYIHGLGIKAMLAEFSPIPGTPDGEACRKWTDIDEPLNHNKTAFVIRRFGEDGVQRMKDICRGQNRG